MFNPMKLMKLKEMGERFRALHPRIPGFMDAAVRNIKEGSVIEMMVTDPEGKTIRANIRVTAEDMEMLREAKEIMAQMGQQN